MDKEQLKNDIQNLINDFRINYQKYKHEQEANTETKLVEPLFKLLGWNKEDFVKRESAHREGKRGFADYGFKIDGRIAFFLEVKRVGIPLEKEADKQVISYALSKRIPFAVSTNFEELKIFCVEQENATTQIFRVFKKPEDYISNLQNLMLLSKESFEKNLILKEAENEGRLKKRMSINKILLDDLMNIRKLIADDIEKTYPQKYEVNDKEEIVQRIIDRLIFIRRCEDVGMNPENIYLEEVKHLPDNKAYPKLKGIFEKYNDIYNSGLFAVGVDNDCDIIKIDGLIIKKLIGYLYESKDKEYIYNFDWIDADVLGQVYEQYLGKLLQQTKSGRTKLKDGQAHKKEQGIYYTPTYVVDYIVRNTLVEALKDKKVKPQNIKILDCACGSGSFLIKAFDYLYESLSSKEEIKQQKIDSQGAYSIKTEILKRNIFGVDLDNKAVEITKLNLLLKASEKNRRLPEEVDLHIKHGNSLVDDESIDKNAFKWEDDFKGGSFDIVIGNPPYVDYREIEGTEFMKKKFYSAQVKDKYNLLVLFIEQGLKLLKEGGFLGFIVSNQFLCSDFGINIRKFILENSKINQLIDVSMIKVFRDASTYPIIIILEKTKPKKNIIKIAKPKDEIELMSKLLKFDNISQEIYDKFDKKLFLLELSDRNLNIIDKMKENSKPLKDCVEEITWGTSATGYGKKKIKQDKFLSLSKKEQEKYIKIIQTADIQRYRIDWQKEFIPKNIYTENKLKLFGYDKIVVGRLNKFLKATIDTEKYVLGKATLIIPKKEINIKFLLALLNSKLIDYYFKLLFKSTHMSQGYIRYDIPYLEQLPIKNASESQQQNIIQMTDKMVSLNKRLTEIGNKTTSETKDLNDKIDKLNKNINKTVYQLYGLNDKEIEAVENS